MHHLSSPVKHAPMMGFVFDDSVAAQKGSPSAGAAPGLQGTLIGESYHNEAPFPPSPAAIIAALTAPPPRASGVLPTDSEGEAALSTGLKPPRGRTSIPYKNAVTPFNTPVEQPFAAQFSPKEGSPVEKASVGTSAARNLGLPPLGRRSPSTEGSESDPLAVQKLMVRHEYTEAELAGVKLSQAIEDAKVIVLQAQQTAQQQQLEKVERELADARTLEELNFRELREAVERQKALLEKESRKLRTVMHLLSVAKERAGQSSEHAESGKAAERSQSALDEAAAALSSPIGTDTESKSEDDWEGMDAVQRREFLRVYANLGRAVGEVRELREEMLDSNALLIEAHNATQELLYRIDAERMADHEAMKQEQDAVHKVQQRQRAERDILRRLMERQKEEEIAVLALGAKAMDGDDVLTGLQDESDARRLQMAMAEEEIGELREQQEQGELELVQLWTLFRGQLKVMQQQDEKIAELQSAASQVGELQEAVSGLSESLVRVQQVNVVLCEQAQEQRTALQSALREIGFLRKSVFGTDAPRDAQRSGGSEEDRTLEAMRQVGKVAGEYEQELDALRQQESEDELEYEQMVQRQEDSDDRAAYEEEERLPTGPGRFLPRQQQPDPRRRSPRMFDFGDRR